MSRQRILIADDQADIRASLALVLQSEGYETGSAASPAEAMLLLERGAWDALLLDLNFRADTTSGEEGLALLSSVKQINADLPVIVLTGWGSVGLAVRALRAGAADFLEKPWENTRLLGVLRAQLALEAARRATAALTIPLPQGAILHSSATMRAVMALVAKIAHADVPVLITGESGTGKGMLARHIASVSPRHDKPFVTVDLGAVPETLIESELFGHARGAFTDAKTDRPGRFEIANDGVIFLDEIGNASLSTQARLLGVLEDGQITRVGEARPRRVDVRLIAATNADLQERIAAGGFRRDLFFRLNTVEIALPPLRERIDDIPLLAGQFLLASASRHNRPARGFAPDAMAALTTYSWPGNVRELAHVVERAALLAEGETVHLADLRLTPAGPAPVERMTLDQAERYLIQRAMADAGGDAEAAAKQLGLSRSAFYRRLASLRK
ncbi:sigma-54-dependent transcriptional regulator [Acidiphilium iwatense]|uniref:Sigma-54 dependent transcriptional regulator n=1 Tax=Acidiphilium iwatense TaxID=768198 RepID=A0ABS9DYX7_9PROT|nr:sigma-54 dependent transcriptional regulator [Acidiphilium iwatense]MCF3947955.1 sigma-54 dependent transcriptional regulator [Acidiphilium iwatense]